MCGIVGLHLRNPDLHPRLGEMLAGMLGEMQDRGADSAGIAVYGNPTWAPSGHGCISLLELDVLPDEVSTTLSAALGVPVAASALFMTIHKAPQSPGESHRHAEQDKQQQHPADGNSQQRT